MCTNNRTQLCATNEYDDKDVETHELHSIHCTIPSKPFAMVVVGLPFFGLIFCFITAVVFNFEDVNKTECMMTHTIPSVSAVTGVAPWRYIWQTCIALQSMPRFLVGFIYYNYYMSRLPLSAKKHQAKFRKMASIAFWIYSVENFCLCFVNCVPNVENYPLHEKIFVVFMLSSVSHMFVVLILYIWSHPVMTKLEQFSYQMKRLVYIINLLFTSMLLVFFIRHRMYCEPGAFDFFSLSEYGIAFSNMIFHYSAIYDFKGTYFILGKPGNSHSTPKFSLENIVKAKVPEEAMHEKSE